MAVEPATEGEPAAQDDRFRVEKVDGERDRLAQCTGGPADDC